MLNAAREKMVLARQLRRFAQGECTFDAVEECAVGIRDRWTGACAEDLPQESVEEVALWAAVWEITSACRGSMLSASGASHPVLQHIAYLEGAEPVPTNWRAKRP